MSEEEASALVPLLRRGHAVRNLGFGLTVGAVVATGVYYAFVISPEETVHDPRYYVGLGVVLGVSLGVVIAVVMTVGALWRAAAGEAH
ncbi:MAG: hypothetical protein ACLFM8_04065 [Halobacteriales archaeon]